MPNQILIEGADVIAGKTATGPYWVDFNSVTVDQDIAVQQTTASFDLYIRGTYQGNGQCAWPIAAPRGKQEVVFLDANGVRQFGGILFNPTRKRSPPIRWSITASAPTSRNGSTDTW